MAQLDKSNGAIDHSVFVKCRRKALQSLEYGTTPFGRLEQLATRPMPFRWRGRPTDWAQGKAKRAAAV